MLDPTTSADEAMTANLANWDSRVPIHAGPGGYPIHLLVDNPDHLSPVVAFDVERLGDLTGLDVVHLQCHLGTDTLSLARMGATVTGLDFSNDALQVARQIAEQMDIADARWVTANVYDAVDALGEQYDMVYTGVGALNWLPNIRQWAEVVAALLRPGGRLHLFDGHPFLETLSMESTAEHPVVSLPYFETEAPMRWVNDGTYEGEGVVAEPVMFEWNHGLGEVIQAVIDAGMTITLVQEHRVLPWIPRTWVPVAPGTDKWGEMPPHLRDVIPMSYCLQATKP